MSEDILDKEDLEKEEHSNYKPDNQGGNDQVHHLSGMYQNWFLDYASYVILERLSPISSTASSLYRDESCTP